MPMKIIKSTIKTFSKPTATLEKRKRLVQHVWTVSFIHIWEKIEGESLRTSTSYASIWRTNLFIQILLTWGSPPPFKYLEWRCQWFVDGLVQHGVLLIRIWSRCLRSSLEHLLQKGMTTSSCGCYRMGTWDTESWRRYPVLVFVRLRGETGTSMAEWVLRIDVPIWRTEERRREERSFFFHELIRTILSFSITWNVLCPKR